MKGTDLSIFSTKGGGFMFCQEQKEIQENEVTECYNNVLHSMITAKSWTIQEFANKCGVSRSAISLIIHGHRKPSLELTIKMSKILDVDSRIIFPFKVKDE